MPNWRGIDLGLLQWSLEKFISKLPLARKEQLLSVAQIHAGEVAYFRLAKQGFHPKGIIDIGAFKGDWTRQIAAIFPGVSVLMVEARTEMKMLLDSVHVDIPAASSAICLLGSKEGADVVFNVMETGSSIYSERSNAPRTQRTITMKTLDQLIRENPKLKASYFVKLDVQGADSKPSRAANPPSHPQRLFRLRSHCYIRSGRPLRIRLLN